MFDVYGPLQATQLNMFVSVGILLQYFHRKLLQLKWNKTVSNLVMSRLYRWPSCVPLLLLRELDITTLQVSPLLRIKGFSITQPFVLKIEELSHIMSVCGSQDLQALSPSMAPRKSLFAVIISGSVCVTFWNSPWDTDLQILMGTCRIVCMCLSYQLSLKIICNSWILSQMYIYFWRCLE